MGINNMFNLGATPFYGRTQFYVTQLDGKYLTNPIKSTQCTLSLKVLSDHPKSKIWSAYSSATSEEIKASGFILGANYDELQIFCKHQGLKHIKFMSKNQEK